MSNETAEWEFQYFQGTPNGNFPTVFKQFCSHLGKTLLDLFPSRLDQYDHWQSQSQYQILLKMIIENPILYSNHPKVLLSLEGKIHPLIQNSSLRLAAMLVLSKIYLQKEYTKRAINLISNARRTGYLSNYQPVWRKWINYSHRKQTDFFSNDLREMLDFASEMFASEFEYSTINTYRSAMSALHGPTERLYVGKHPKVCNLMTGAYNKRFPKPRYWFAWDIEIVLKYLRSLPMNKNVNIKIKSLPALTSASKRPEIRHLDISFTEDLEKKLCVNMIRPTKTSTPSKSYQC